MAPLTYTRRSTTAWPGPTNATLLKELSSLELERSEGIHPSKRDTRMYVGVPVGLLVGSVALERCMTHACPRSFLIPQRTACRSVVSPSPPESNEATRAKRPREAGQRCLPSIPLTADTSSSPVRASMELGGAIVVGSPCSSPNSSVRKRRRPAPPFIATYAARHLHSSPSHTSPVPTFLSQPASSLRPSC